MTPLDRGTTSPSAQQDTQASNSQQAGGSQQTSSSQRTESSLQGNIANVGVANASQPVTMPVAANAPQFQSVSTYPNLVQSGEGFFYHIFNFSNQQVIPALSSNQAINLPLQQINAHKALLNGIHIPVFKHKLKFNFIISENRLRLQLFLKEVFTRLEGLECCYDRATFISSLLIQADRCYLERQTLEALNQIIGTYIFNPSEKEYLKTNWNINWPSSRLVREIQDPKNYNVTNITPDIKKNLYLKMEELDQVAEHSYANKYIKRIRCIDAAFAYGVPPGVIKTWIRSGKQFHQAQTAGGPPAREAGELVSQARPLASAQAQAATFNPGIVIDDDQRPGPSRSARTSATLRFEPYQRPQPQAPSLDPRIQNQAQALGLTAETLQAFNLETELDAAFNRQMEVLPWPRVTSEQFIREPNSGRYVIAPASRTAIGRFIIENCPADARVYRFAALRYGVALSEIVKWASEASE